ncbi:hypothetical protein [Pasteurella atlantica]
MDFSLTGKEVYDSKKAEHLLELIPNSEYVITDRGYDSQDVHLIQH